MSPILTGWSYFGVRNPKHVAEDLEDMVEHGANAVLFTLSEEDVAFYLDTMRELVELAHARRMVVYVNPWAWGGVFGGEAFSGFLARNPDARQVDSAGRPVPAACFHHPKFRDAMLRWLDAAQHVGADIAMWDEPHFFIFDWDPELSAYKGRWTCRCRHCRKRFRTLYGFEMPVQRTPEIEEFRHRSILSFLDTMAREARSRGLRNSICILPPSFGLDDGLLRYEEVFDLEAIDIVATDPYWREENDLAWVEREYSANATWLIREGKRTGREVEIWVKNFKVRRGQEEFVRHATRVAFEKGIRRILAWSYLGSAYMSALRSDDPLLVYRTQAEAFRACREMAT
ncbi:MAG: hypothetical protein ONB23_00585 [candidate division KSB1 bacterium]|nr:hypothetical protein [candidate division KSB1 bacterium]